MFTVVGKRTYSASPGIRRGNRPRQGSSSSQYADANRVYANDCLSEESEVDEFQQTSCEIIRSASMERRKWSGNNIIFSQAGMKVLTTTWDTELDQKSIVLDTRREDQEWLTRFW